MGPRARRRLAWTAVLVGIVGLVVVGVAIHYATGSGSLTPKQQQSALGSMNLGISDGATQRGVLHRLGRPTGKQGRCWIYHASTGKVGGIYVGKNIDAVRF